MQFTEPAQDVQAGAQYLGPAEVLGRTGPYLQVLTPDGEVRARLALAYPYAPATGDVVLLIGQGSRHWVIGVLRGNGRACLEFSGDVTLRAVDGMLDLAGDRGVRIEGPRVEMRAGKLEMLADKLVQKFTTAHHRVRELLSFRAGRMHTVVRDDTLSKARNATILADRYVTVNGEQIRLG